MSDEPTMTSAFWFTEDVTPDLMMRMRLEKITFDKQSDFQRAQIVETTPFGKTLVLDGKTQSALADEYVYHESLVHPALLTHPNPRSVYIGGGGELATAREVLKHKSVERCVMVDIDEVVVKICRDEMPEWGGQAVIDDRRMELHYDDAKAWLERTEEKFDVIIMDIADPIEAGPGYVLYTEEFYKFAVSKLNPGGILVTQSGPGSHMNITECCTVIHQTLHTAFDHVVPYTADIPSFGSNWAFNMAFNNDSAVAAAAAMHGASPGQYILEQPIAATDRAIEARIEGELRFLDGVARRGIFGIPKSVRKALAAETRHMTIDNPVFMY
jgi:spermidine synthase